MESRTLRPLSVALIPLQEENIHILNFTISPFLNHNVSTGDQSVVKKQLVQ